MRKKIICEGLNIIWGLLVFSLGDHLTIFANIGLSPWDCFGMGLAAHAPFGYGIAMTLTALVILGVDLWLKERIGYGTVIDAFCTGNFVDMFNHLNPLPPCGDVWLGIPTMLAGLALMAMGMCIYMRSAQCCGPRDALLIGIGKRLRSIPIGIVEVIIFAVVLLSGWLLGGPVGIGTLISAFGAGLVMQAIYNIIHFDPRHIQHRDIVAVTREWFK